MGLLKGEHMIKRFISQQSSRHRIRFNQLKSCLCPMCNSLVFFDNKDNAFKCQSEDCSYREEKMDYAQEYENVLN